MARRIFSEIYSRNSVLELKESAKVKTRGEWKEYYGRLLLRAANLETGDNHKEIVMSLSPTECYKLATVIKHVVKNGGRKTAIVHRPQQDEAKFTEVVVEKWENNGRSGYAIILQIRIKENDRDRIETRINIPVEKLELLALASFLENLNTSLRWREVIKVQQEASDEAPADEPIDDIEDIDIDDIDM
jgi:hypothetical protein